MSLPNSFQNASDLVRKVYTLARPFGRKKLLIVSGLSLLQGLFQVLGVTSVFPFLALAANPEKIGESQLGQQILNFLPAMNERQLLFSAGSFAILMLFLSNGINLFAELVRTRYAHGFGHWLRLALLRKISSRNYTEFLNENAAVLVKKVCGDVLQFSSGVLLALLDIFARLATVILLIATLFLLHPLITVGAVFLLGVFYLIVFGFFGKWRDTATEGLKKANRGSSTEAYQMLVGIKTVKMHGAESFFIDRYSNHSALQARLLALIPIVGNGPRYLVEPLAFGGVVAVVLVYAAQGQDITSILPTLSVMALAGYRLLPALQILYGQLNLVATNRHTLEEIYDEFLAVEKSANDELAISSTSLAESKVVQWNKAIKLENIHFTYTEREKPIIDNFSLKITKNSSVGIIGSTGSGKSTLIDIILGLHRPTNGRILIDDIELSDNNSQDWRRGIGYVPQEIFLIDDTIAANIAFGVPKNKIDLQALIRAAKAAQILEFIENDLIKTWGTLVGDRGIRLSGGQRQRIGLARALYHNPTLLILDEATSALDLKTETEVMSAIHSLQGDITTLIVAHRLSTIESCDKVIKLQPKDPEDPSANTL